MEEKLKDPLVSVVLPTFNRSHLIARAIKSVLNQTYRNLELIIVDDGSTDATQATVSDISDDRLRYIRLEHNVGANAARNIGISNAVGEYIAFQDSDDEWRPQKLLVQISAINDSGSQVAFSSELRVSSNGSIKVPKSARPLPPSIKHDYRIEILRGNFVGLPTLIVDKSLILKINGFNESLVRLQEWELCIRLSKYAEFIFTEEILVDHYIGDDSITLNKAYMPAVEKVLGLHEEAFKDDPTSLGLTYLNLFLDAFQSSEPTTAIRYLLKSVTSSKLYFPNVIRIMLARYSAVNQRAKEKTWE